MLQGYLLVALLFLLTVEFLSVSPYPSTNPNGPVKFRYFSMDMSDQPNGESFNTVLSSAELLYVDTTTLSLDWNSIETSPRSYVDPSGVLGIANEVYPQSNLNLTLTIRSIDTTGPVVPADIDIATVPWNSSLLIDRYCEMIAFVLNSLSSVSLTNVMVANEVDAQSIFKYNPPFWLEWRIFIGNVTQCIHQQFPMRTHTKVGFTLQHTAMMAAYTDSTTTGNMMVAATYGECLGITYYPLAINYSMLSASSPLTDFPEIVSNLPSSVPLYIQEIGYSTSNWTLSSPQLQAEYFTNVLSVWNTYNDRIPFLSILRYSDLSESAAMSLASAYGLQNNVLFVEYLRTLGVVYYNGTTKASYSTIQQITTAFVNGNGVIRSVECNAALFLVTLIVLLLVL